ncbi:ABC transporter permease subunit [Wenjunlia tyrosinilytica]|uniref:Membrane protein n=1 Tax=Wenjunlia tyrosinilytica TaxID=1544741 RepID=A0A917ZPA8_9ACTN|nr:ABC transporter permease subunit [Wenjunlia tyrosinilytica]GGO86412.1 membrane protein [Wenjunlia tyrosinilytica]
MPVPSSTSPATEAAKGRIHNIGYRHYDGPRLGRSYATRSLLVQSLRGAYGLGRSAKSKVLPMILFAVMCMPAGIIVAVAVFTKMKDLPLDYTSYAIYLQAVIGIFLAAQAPQAVSRDLRFKTVPLYFSRPIERIDYVFAKFAAMTGAVFILTAAPLVVLYIGALLAKLSFGTQTKDFAAALLAALLLSLLYAGLGLVIAALTPRRGFGVAAIIALFTISYGAVSSVQAIAGEQGNETVAGWLGLFSPVTLIDGVQSWALGAEPSSPAGPPNAFAGTVFVLVLLGAIAGSFGLLLLRYRKVGLS